MGRYLDMVQQDERQRAEEKRSGSKESEELQKLRAMGWKSKESFGGVVIWERPDTGCYVSEEMALHLEGQMQRGERERGKRKGVTQL